MSCPKTNHGWVIQIHRGSYLGPSGAIVDSPAEAQLFERLIMVWPEVDRLIAEGFTSAMPQEWIDN